MLLNCPACESILIRNEYYSVKCSNKNCKYHINMTEKFINQMALMIKQNKEQKEFENTF